MGMSDLPVGICTMFMHGVHKGQKGALDPL